MELNFSDLDIAVTDDSTVVPSLVHAMWSDEIVLVIRDNPTAILVASQTSVHVLDDESEWRVKSDK